MRTCAADIPGTLERERIRRRSYRIGGEGQIRNRIWNGFKLLHVAKCDCGFVGAYYAQSCNDVCGIKG